MSSNILGLRPFRGGQGVSQRLGGLVYLAQVVAAGLGEADDRRDGVDVAAHRPSAADHRLDQRGPGAREGVEHEVPGLGVLLKQLRHDGRVELGRVPEKLVGELRRRSVAQVQLP
jgi:hypothetical protein